MVLLSLPGRCRPAAGIAILSLAAGLAMTPDTVGGQPPSFRSSDEPAPMSVQRIDAAIAEAARRFALPERWIWLVMHAESAGDPDAVSRAGAMGLMQIMPATWSELRVQHALGADSFDNRDNILAGTAYLRQMHDRFGAPGFLAAYHAGPGRYADYLETGRPLPRETRAYVARLAPLIDGPNTAPLQIASIVAAAHWRAAPIFVGQIERNERADASLMMLQADEEPAARQHADNPHVPRQPEDLFIRFRSDQSG